MTTRIIILISQIKTLRLGKTENVAKILSLAAETPGFAFRSVCAPVQGQAEKGEEGIITPVIRKHYPCPRREESESGSHMPLHQGHSRSWPRRGRSPRRPCKCARSWAWRPPSEKGCAAHTCPQSLRRREGHYSTPSRGGRGRERHYDFRGSDTLFSGRVMLEGWSHTGARKHKQQLSVIPWNSADKDFPVWKILLNISTHCTLTRNSKHPISSPLANIAHVSVQ